MQHPDEGTIHAWIDGELSREEAAALEAHAVECAQCSATIAEARGLVAASSRIVSALDIVPGGVIPAVIPVAIPRQRAWYASGQLRAAAAVLFVAGASLLVLRTEKRGTESAVVADVAEDRPAIMGSESVLDTTTNGAGVVAPMIASHNVLQGRVAGAAIPVAPQSAPATATLSSPVVEDSRRDLVAPDTLGKSRVSLFDAQRDSVARRRAAFQSPVALDQLVVTGVATAAPRATLAATAAKTTGELRKVRTDTTVNSRRTIYEVSPGVNVTLTESGIPSASRERRRTATQSEAAASAPPGISDVTIGPRSAAQNADSTINSITWNDSATGHIYVLSGPLPKAKLEAIRRQLASVKP